MHELSIAMSIVDGVIEEAKKHPDERVDIVHLQLGTLSGVVKEALLFSFDIACEGTSIEGSSLSVQEMPAAIYCRKCGCEREICSIQAFICPVCRGPSAELVRGRELIITGLELVNEYAASIG